MDVLALGKVVPALFMPLPLALLAMTILMIRAFWRGNPGIIDLAAKLIASLILILTMALSLPAVSDALASVWETPPGTMATLGAEPWDTAVVLGGSIDPSLTSPENYQYMLGNGAERLTAAAQLWHAGKVRMVLFSGGSGDPWQPEQSEAPLARAFLRSLLVADNAIVTEGESRNTEENTTAVKSLLEGLDGKRHLLVTSAFHMPRSLALFRKAGLAVTPYPVDPSRINEYGPMAWIPSARALDQSSRFLREIMGMAWYALSGRI